MPITTAPVSGGGAPEDIATPEDSVLTRHRRHDGLDTDGMAALSEIFAEEAGPEAVPPCTLEVKIYGPKTYPNGFSRLAAEWNDLLARSRYDSFFLTHEWQSVWWQELGNGDLWILAFYADACREDDAAAPELVGIAPFFLHEHKRGKWAGKRSLQLVGCVEVSDFLDMLIAVGWERSVYYCLLSWLQSEDAPAWDYIDLCNLPEESLSYRVLPSIFERAGLRVEVKPGGCGAARASTTALRELPGADRQEAAA